MKEPFALDISDSSLKLVCFKKKRRIFVFGTKTNLFTIEHLFQKSLPSGMVEQGEIKKEPELIELIKETLKERKIKSKRVIASFPDSKVFIRVVQIPQMSEEELKEAIQWETEQHLPLSIDQVYLDYQILLENPAVEKGQIGVLICASPKESVDSFINLFKKIGLIPFVLEPTSQAVVRSLIKKEEIKDKAILIINLKEEKASLIICDFETIQNVFSVSLSSKNIQDSLLEGIKNSLDFYKGHFEKAHSISKAIVCGERKDLKEIISFLREKFSFPIEMPKNLFADLSFSEEISQEKKLGFVAPIGLALRNFYV